MNVTQDNSGVPSSVPGATPDTPSNATVPSRVSGAATKKSKNKKSGRRRGRKVSRAVIPQQASVEQERTYSVADDGVRPLGMNIPSPVVIMLFARGLCTREIEVLLSSDEMMKELEEVAEGVSANYEEWNGSTPEFLQNIQRWRNSRLG
jgi:hypothetical protein